MDLFIYIFISEPVERKDIVSEDRVPDWATGVLLTQAAVCERLTAECVLNH